MHGNEEPVTEPVSAYLVANARYHDTDFARLELLKPREFGGGQFSGRWFGNCRFAGHWGCLFGHWGFGGL